MGTRKATRNDLKKVLEFRNSDQFVGKWDDLEFKLYHSECKRGRIKSHDGSKLHCFKCKTSWGETRPDTWTEQEIETKFWVETPMDQTVYQIVNKGGYYGLAEAPVPSPTKAVDPGPAPVSWLDKARQSLGKP